MAAPSKVGATITLTSSNTNPWVATITNGWTAGNSIVLVLATSPTTIRTVSSIVASNGDTFTLEPGATNSTLGGSGTAGSVEIYRCLVATTMPAAGTVTVNWNAGATGNLWLSEWSAFTSAALVDTKGDAANTSNHTSGTTGLTTNGDVLVVAAGVVGGTPGVITQGANYTLGNTGSFTMWQYRASDTALSADTGPWTSGTARQNRGVMAAFYAVAAPSGGSAYRNIKRREHRPAMFRPGIAR
jgi:hypothetical protein